MPVFSNTVSWVPGVGAKFKLKLAFSPSTAKSAAEIGTVVAAAKSNEAGNRVTTT